MNRNIKCCILGCNNKDIISLCKKCKIYFCLNHDKLINSHELVNLNISLYNNFYCCDYCCNKHFHVQCSICNDMIINTMSIKKNNNIICKYPCFKYQK